MPRKSSVAVPFSESTATRIAPPDDLVAGSPERSLFLDLVLSVRADHFQPSDAPLLAAYCRALALEQTASGELAAGGYITAEGRPSPWLPVLQHAARTISTYSRMLRLNPSARQMTPASDRERPVVSAFERIALEAQADGRS
jgi:phage terminase small subunit